MKRLIIKLSILSLLIGFAGMMCGSYAVAQDYPKAEFFGGVSFFHLDTEGITAATVGAPAGTSIKSWYPGWEIAGQYNLTKLFGIKADFSGHYGTPVTVPGVSGLPGAKFYTFLFGPVISYRTDRFTPFVHAVFGFNHLSLDSSTVSFEGAKAAQPGFSENAFAMAFGGGVDVKLTRHFALRLGQFDYVYTKHCLNVPADFAGAGNAGGCLLGVGTAPPAHQNNFHFSTGIVIH